jgi:hypothetical protein
MLRWKSGVLFTSKTLRGEWVGLEEIVACSGPPNSRRLRGSRPGRYMVTTSQGLTPGRKAEIRDVFEPYCEADDDAYGRDDLNNLLTLHPRIEEQNFKLWLTSDVVLQRIVRAAMLQDTARAVEHMRTRVAMCRTRVFGARWTCWSSGTTA